MALFVPLDASYAHDPKVLDLDDERAELLYLRGLAYSKLHVLDGVIHRRALQSITPFAEDVPGGELAAELVRVGLWIEHPSGWRIAAWLKHNPGSEEILSASTARKMAHTRHHSKKGIVKAGCPFCVAEDPQVNADGCATQCDADTARHLPEPEPQPESEPTTTAAAVSAQPDQQTIRATAARIGHVVASDQQAANPGGYAASVTRRILTDPDGRDDLDRIRTELGAGSTPEAIAAAWCPDPLVSTTTTRPEQPRGPRLPDLTGSAEAVVAAGPTDAGRDAMASARARLRGVS